MKKTAVLLGVCLWVAGAVQAEVIISDDFSTDTAATTANRLRTGNVGNNWVKNSNGTLWTVNTVAGTVGNAGTSTTEVDNESGLLRVYDVGAASLTGDDLTHLTFSFDYTVGTGSTLYFHAIGLNDGTLGGNAQLHNFITDGGIQSQYDNNGQPTSGDFTGTNLKDGAASPSGAAAGAWSFAAGTSGTFTQTVNISGYTGIDDINDFQYLTMGFASDVTDITGAGAISIDNFSVIAIPEPAVGCFVVFFGGGIFVLQRRVSEFNGFI
jgi:hypothetical protein